MTRKCLSAWTQNEGNIYPPYVSINQEDDGTVEISVRSARLPDGQCGPTVTTTLTKEQFAVFLLGALKEFRP